MYTQRYEMKNFKWKKTTQQPLRRIFSRAYEYVVFVLRKDLFSSVSFNYNYYADILYGNTISFNRETIVTVH